MRPPRSPLHWVHRHPKRRRLDTRDPPWIAAGSLSKLPPELLELLSWYLNKHDICSLRRTCRHVAQCSFRPFKHHFHTLQTDLSRTSLERLLELAKDPELSPRVLHMVIQKPDNDDFGRGYRWGGSPHSPFSQDGFMQFRSVLDGLVNCRELEIRARGPTCPPRFLPPLGALGMMIRLGAVDGFKLKSLVIDVWVHSSSNNRIGFGFIQRLSPMSSKCPNLSKAWKDLESLVVQQVTFKLADSSFNFLLLLRGARRLRKLDLSFVHDGTDQEAFLKGLASIGERFQLQELRLAHAYLGYSTLSINTLFRCQRSSLQKLTLECLGLDGRDRGWKSVLETLRHPDSALRDISLSALSQRTVVTLNPSSLRPYLLFFPAFGHLFTPVPTGEMEFGNIVHLHKRPPESISTFEYSGECMDAALERVVSWSRLSPRGPSSHVS